MPVTESLPLFDEALPARPASLHCLRDHFRHWLERAVPSAFVRRDLVLTMSELASVTLRHESDDESNLHARAWVDGEGIVLEVSDGLGRDAESDESAPELAVVASLVDVLSMRSRGGTAQIRARVDLSSRFEDHAVSP
jgi:hypothetical protein